MDSEIKDALLKLIETGTEIAPHVVHDLLLWAMIKPLSILPAVLFFAMVSRYCYLKHDKEKDFDIYGFLFVSSSIIASIFLLVIVGSISIAIQAHFTPYAYLINLIK